MVAGALSDLLTCQKRATMIRVRAPFPMVLVFPSAARATWIACLGAVAVGESVVVIEDGVVVCVDVMTCDEDDARMVRTMRGWCRSREKILIE
jgi:hypothetical protein